MAVSPDALSGRRVLVWGIGRHGGGLAAARFCAEQGAEVRLLDRTPAAELGRDGAEAARWPCATGGAGHPWIAESDLIVASPAIPPRAWPDRHPPVTSPEGLFFAAHRGPRLAVTGTKGKSTTSRIAGALLGWPVAGNSYEPLLDLLRRLGPGTPVVCELSSFQLWYLREQRPRFAAAILTTLGRDHLDWHPDLAHYESAKLALFAWADAAIAAPALAPRLPTASILPPVACADGEFRAADGALLARRADLDLLGDHNADNAGLAIAAALRLGAPPGLVAERLRTVRPLPHRLQTVHRSGGLTFIDDSIATTPESAMAGLAAVPGPVAVILGGSDKGATWQDLAAAVVRRGAVAVTMGATGPAIAAAVRAAGGQPSEADDLEIAVSYAGAALRGAGTVLLAPACASFDAFRGFEHRGDCFAEAARALFPERL
jgi:UDP-N-acetylmuramoylalanine--D-glutamate ligase